MNITIYGTTWCAFCKTEKQWLDSKDVNYAYKEVDTDEEALKSMQSLNIGNGVPITTIEKDGKTETVVGFDRKKLGDIIGI